MSASSELDEDCSQHVKTEDRSLETNGTRKSSTVSLDHTEASQVTLGPLTDQNCKPIPFRLRQVGLLDRGFRGKEFSRLDIDAFVSTRTEMEKAHDRLDSCPTRFGECIRATPKAVVCLDRRSETVN